MGRYSIIIILASLATIASASAVETAPVRHLVYSFKRAVEENVTVQVQATPHSWQQQSEEQRQASRSNQQFVAPGDEVPQNATDAMESSEGRAASPLSGSLDAHAANETSGTIAVDVVRQQPDRGLVVSIRENAKSGSAAPETCVVYANTSLVCDSQHTVNPEEYSLLRFLGAGFLDPTAMDSQRHWRIDQSGSDVNVTADYKIVGSAGETFTIDEAQTIGSKTGTVATIRSTIAYDFSRSLPTSIDERVVQTPPTGTQKTARDIRTVLQLVSVTP